MTSREQANAVTKTIQSIIHLVIKGDIMCILSNNESEHDIVFEWAKKMVKHVMTTNVITCQDFGINTERRLTLDDEIENWFYRQWHVVEHTDIFTIPEYPNTISFHGAPSFFESRSILYINPATIRYSPQEFVYSEDEEIPATLPARFISWLATQPPTTPGQPQPQPITYIKETTTPITFQSPECPVCLTAKPNCITNCQHEFCRVCIDELVEKNPTKHNCPLCRTIIATLTSN